MGSAVRSRSRGGLVWTGAAGSTLAALLLAIPATPAGAATQAGSAAYACTGGTASAITVPLQFSAPDAVPADGAAEVQASAGFGPFATLAGPGAAVTRVDLTFALEDPVGDVDLGFSAASIKARDWDARGGSRSW